MRVFVCNKNSARPIIRFQPFTPFVLDLVRLYWLVHNLKPLGPCTYLTLGSNSKPSTLTPNYTTTLKSPLPDRQRRGQDAALRIPRPVNQERSSGIHLIERLRDSVCAKDLAGTITNSISGARIIRLSKWPESDTQSGIVTWTWARCPPR